MHGAVSSPATLDTLSMVEGLFHISLSISTRPNSVHVQAEWSGQGVGSGQGA